MKSIYLFFLKRYLTDEDQLVKAKLVINFVFIEIVVCAIDYVFYNYFSFRIPRFNFLLMPALLVGNLLLLRTKISFTLAAHLTVFTFWFSFGVILVFAGGVFSIIVSWLAILPVMAYLLTDRKGAMAWFIVSALTILFFTFFFTNPHILEGESTIRRLFITNTGLVAIIFFFVHLFYKAETKLLVAIKENNLLLMEQKEEISTQNEELIEQRDEILAQRDMIQQQNEMLRKQNEEIVRMNGELSDKVDEISNRSVVLESHWHTLLAISKSKIINFGELKEALCHISKIAATSLSVDRISVWHYSSKSHSIECLVLYHLDGDHFEHGSELFEKDYANYFEALKSEEVVVASEAEENSMTREFKDSYLRPLQIVSMLDAPYFLDGKLGGVICCEHKSARAWQPEDILFVRALSDIVTLTFRATQRRQYEQRIRENRKEIARVNLSLEDKIRERTRELENQNLQLSEYAFINSHILRGPLCRILGLVNLMDYLEVAQKEQELINHLKLSGQELDNVVKKINKAIDNGSHFDRNELSNL